MTYAPLPVHQPTFIAVTGAGGVALVAAAVLAVVQPLEATRSTVAEAATIDVSVTGSLSQRSAAGCEMVTATPAAE